MQQGQEAGPDSIQQFLSRAARHGELELPSAVRQHRIGGQAEVINRIYDLIRAGEKTGTFAVPWIDQRSDKPDPEQGDLLVLIDFAGEPQMLIRLTDVFSIRFGDITAEHTAIDGPAIREVGVWKAMHEQYWNSQLSAYDLAVTDDMPVWVEHFEVVYAE